jgi:hypothetical protein
MPGAQAACLCLTLAVSFEVPVLCRAHDQPVHQAIAFSAALSSSGFQQFLDFNFLSGSTFLKFDSQDRGVTNWITEGAFHEDDFPRFDDHFYTVSPTRTPGLANGLTDRSELLQLNFAEITNSFAWGTVPGLRGPASIRSTNSFTWSCTRAYELAALTNDLKADRDASMAQMFLSLGHILHLNEDLSQPDHVRNDEHLWSWHRFIENYGSGTYLRQATNAQFFTYFPLMPHGWAYWQGQGFSKLLDFWDRGLYTGSAFDLDADAGGGERLGLAEWSNGNFLGEDTRYAEFYSPSSFHYFPHPSLADTDQPQLNAHTYTQVLDPITLANGKQGYRPYLKKTGAGIEIEHHSALHYIAVRHSPKISTPRMWAAVTINDTNVLQEYHANFIPKAIEYSAGILDYFFRGTLGVGFSTDGTNNLIITNTSSQDFANGTFHLFYDDTSGNRSELTSPDFTTEYTSGHLAAGDYVSANATFPTNSTNYVLIYQGTIGTSNGTNADPVDSDISIALTSFVTPPLWSLNWDAPEDDSYNGGTFSASGLDTNTWTTAVSVLNLGSVGSTANGGAGQIVARQIYAGPGTNCNLRLTISTTDSAELYSYVEITQDGNSLFGEFSDFLAPGTYDYPFAVNADTGGIIVVTWSIDMEFSSSDNSIYNSAGDSTITGVLSVVP